MLIEHDGQSVELTEGEELGARHVARVGQVSCQGCEASRLCAMRHSGVRPDNGLPVPPPCESGLVKLARLHRLEEEGKSDGK